MRLRTVLVLVAAALTAPFALAAPSATWHLSTDLNDAGLAMHRGWEQGGSVVVIPSDSPRLWVSDQSASAMMNMQNKSYLLRLHYNGGGVTVETALGFERKLGGFEMCADALVPQDIYASLPPGVSSVVQRTQRLIEFELDASCVAQPGDRLALSIWPTSDMFVYTTTTTDVLGARRPGTTLSGDGGVVG